MKISFFFLQNSIWCCCATNCRFNMIFSDGFSLFETWSLKLKYFQVAFTAIIAPTKNLYIKYGRNASLICFPQEWILMFATLHFNASLFNKHFTTAKNKSVVERKDKKTTMNCYAINFNVTVVQKTCSSILFYFLCCATERIWIMRRYLPPTTTSPPHPPLLYEYSDSISIFMRLLWHRCVLKLAPRPVRH